MDMDNITDKLQKLKLDNKQRDLQSRGSLNIPTIPTPEEVDYTEIYAIMAP